MKTSTWFLTDHLCRACGGRILKCATNCGATPGGNTVWKCADCGKSASGFNPDVLCWCGFQHKFNIDSTPYVCVSFSILKENPELLDSFLACGCDPKRGGEVGIMLEKDFKTKKKTNER
jgi:hypothetical protein